LPLPSWLAARCKQEGLGLAEIRRRDEYSTAALRFHGDLLPKVKTILWRLQIGAFKKTFPFEGHANKERGLTPRILKMGNLGEDANTYFLSAAHGRALAIQGRYPGRPGRHFTS